MSRLPAIPLRVLIGLCLGLLALNGIVLTVIFYLLNLPLIFLFVLFAFVVGVIVLITILSLLWQKPKTRIPSTFEKQTPIGRNKPAQTINPSAKIPGPINVSDGYLDKRVPSRTPTSKPKRPSPTVATKIITTPISHSNYAIAQSTTSDKCPHGKKKEYCAICDRDSYEHHFGDWETD